MEALDKKMKILLVVVSVLVLIICGLAWKLAANVEESRRQNNTVILPENQITNENVYQNEVGLKKEDAKEVVAQIERIKQGKTKSDDSYIEYDTDDEGNYAPVVAAKIEKKDPTLPPLALAKTDKTVVTESKDDKGGAKVDVYKIDTYQDWEIGIGIGRHDGDSYIPVSIQRNYDNVHSIALEAHFSVDRGQFNGAEIQWKVGF